MRNRIRDFRTAKSWTQEDLAKAIAVSRQTINAIELGKFNLSTILALKMAKVFECAVEDIFELEEADWKSK